MGVRRNKAIGAQDSKELARGQIGSKSLQNASKNALLFGVVKTVCVLFVGSGTQNSYNVNVTFGIKL